MLIALRILLPLCMLYWVVAIAKLMTGYYQHPSTIFWAYVVCLMFCIAEVYELFQRRDW